MTKDVFTEIYHNNRWGSTESRSCVGSEIRATRLIVDWLPTLFKKYNIKSVLDIPCGDYNWMKWVDYTGVQYIGADIVDELIVKNRHDYTDGQTQFRSLDLLTDDLPCVDLVFCRDCLVHLPINSIKTALNNIKKSGSRYLCTTTFPINGVNAEIPMGDWRAINLGKEPFGLEFVELFTEGEKARGYEDKSLGVVDVNKMEYFEI